MPVAAAPLVPEGMITGGVGVGVPGMVGTTMLVLLAGTQTEVLLALGQMVV